MIISIGHKFFGSSIILFLIGHLLLGISYIAFLPPWEGFDETAHYSYVQQVADTKSFPRHGKARISEDVENYISFAPIPYSGNPPFEKNGGFTYKSFFDASNKIIKKSHKYINDRPNKPRYYSEGSGLNWQSQHPPLYYLIMSPLYTMTKQLSWKYQLFTLRIISYFFAWLSLVTGVYCCFFILKYEQKNAFFYWAMLGISFYPILFPSWFPSMARIGNDSLCALIVSLIWFVITREITNRQSFKYSIALALLLGFGCLTKAFFVPITLGVLSFWCIYHFKLFGKKHFKSISFKLSVILVIVLCISSWWYIGSWYQYGAISGAADMIALKEQGGLLQGLNKNFSILAWLRGNAAFITTISWCSSWSWVRPPYIYLSPMAFTTIFLFIAYLSSARKFDLISDKGLPLWFILPLLLGFEYHIFSRIALTGEGRATNGYWINVLICPLGVGLGVVLSKMWFRRSFLITFLSLAFYALCISVYTTWAQILLYSGILFKAGKNKFYQFPESIPSVLGLQEAFTRLKTLSLPYLGITAWVFGAISILLGILLILKITLKFRCTIKCSGGIS
jgi:hypothetical protein